MTLRGAMRLATFGAAVLVAAEATAGLDVKTRTVAEGKSGNTGARMRTEGDRLRIDMAAPPSGQGASSLVFDANAQVLRILRHDDESYVEIDRQTADQIGATMAAARKKMQEQLAKMPPQQRALMEKMMQGGAIPLPNPDAPKKAVPLEAKPSGETDDVGGTACTVYALTRGGESKGDVCVAAWDAVGIAPSDIAVLKKLGAFQRKMTEALAGSIPGAEQPFELLERVDGFPLRTRRLEDGKVVSETYFEDLTQRDVPADAFAVPADYTKKSVDRP